MQPRLHSAEGPGILLQPRLHRRRYEPESLACTSCRHVPDCRCAGTHPRTSVHAVPIPSAVPRDRRRVVPRRYGGQRHRCVRVPSAALKTGDPWRHRCGPRTAVVRSARPRNRRLRLRCVRGPCLSAPIRGVVVGPQGPSLKPALGLAGDYASAHVRELRPTGRGAGPALRARHARLDRGECPDRLCRLRAHGAQQPAAWWTVRRDGVHHPPAPSTPPRSCYEPEEPRDDPDHMGPALWTIPRARHDSRSGGGRPRGARRVPATLPSGVPAALQRGAASTGYVESGCDVESRSCQVVPTVIDIDGSWLRSDGCNHFATQMVATRWSPPHPVVVPLIAASPSSGPHPTFGPD